MCVYVFYACLRSDGEEHGGCVRRDERRHNTMRRSSCRTLGHSRRRVGGFCAQARIKCVKTQVVACAVLVILWHRALRHRETIVSKVVWWCACWGLTEVGGRWKWIACEHEHPPCECGHEETWKQWESASARDTHFQTGTAHMRRCPTTPDDVYGRGGGSSLHSPQEMSTQGAATAIRTIQISLRYMETNALWSSYLI